jgi:hypothetical protein
MFHLQWNTRAQIDGGLRKQRLLARDLLDPKGNKSEAPVSKPLSAYEKDTT